jgi:hypothetical protein
MIQLAKDISAPPPPPPAPPEHTQETSSNVNGVGGGEEKAVLNIKIARMLFSRPGRSTYA